MRWHRNDFYGLIKFYCVKIGKLSDALALKAKFFANILIECVVIEKLFSSLGMPLFWEPQNELDMIQFMDC